MSFENLRIKLKKRPFKEIGRAVEPIRESTIGPTLKNGEDTNITAKLLAIPRTDYGFRRKRD